MGQSDVGGAFEQITVCAGVTSMKSVDQPLLWTSRFQMQIHSIQFSFPLSFSLSPSFPLSPSASLPLPLFLPLPSLSLTLCKVDTQKFTFFAYRNSDLRMNENRNYNFLWTNEFIFWFVMQVDDNELRSNTEFMPIYLCISQRDEEYAHGTAGTLPNAQRNEK